MSAPEHVLIVGAGLGGLRTAEQLRHAGYEGRISLIGAEEHLPYDRPPLSKQLLAGKWEPERIALAEEARLTSLDVRTYLRCPAIALRPGEVELANGSVLAADAIVLATGVEACRLPGQPDSVHTLRTLDDALRLREELGRGRKLLVVGAGFIGAEIASTALGLGVDVTILEAASVPLSRGLGEQVGAMCGRLIREGGADLRTGVSITRFAEAPSGVAVELADGSHIEADVAVVGIGGRPDLGWLTDTGLDLANGVRCDTSGRVLGLDGVWAVGDMACWADKQGSHHRHEHWTSTSDQAAVVARAIAGAQAPAPTVPYVWSDQFGLKIQVIGRPERAEIVLPLRGEGLSGGPVKGTIVGYFRADRLVAVAGFGAARDVVRFRPLLLSDETTQDEVMAVAQSLSEPLRVSATQPQL